MSTPFVFMVYGPTLSEMLHPHTIPADIRQQAKKARIDDPLDPINLFNISWRDVNDDICSCGLTTATHRRGNTHCRSVWTRVPIG